MKKAIRIQVIVGMIVGCWTILPLIFGPIVLKKMKNGELTTGWKVMTIIFVSVIAGILMLCDKTEG